jgi:hypothetical protein
VPPPPPPSQRGSLVISFFIFISLLLAFPEFFLQIITIMKLFYKEIFPKGEFLLYPTVTQLQPLQIQFLFSLGDFLCIEAG